METFCCQAPVCVPGSHQKDFDKHLVADWYECSKCGRPCDRMIDRQSWTGVLHEQF